MGQPHGAFQGSMIVGGEMASPRSFVLYEQQSAMDGRA
jgi:hypothetical protein